MPRIVPRPPLDAAAKREQAKLLVEFGTALRSFRNDRDLSLETTADAAGVHPNYLGEVERGKRNISLFNIWRLAAALDVPASTLLEKLPRRKVKPAS
jgi:transcriptional regulator with XRE-family HTH domain